MGNLPNPPEDLFLEQSLFFLKRIKHTVTDTGVPCGSVLPRTFIKEHSMQPRFRALKTTIRTRLQEPGWADFAEELEEMPARELVGPLLSCLPLGGEAMERAAVALGRAVSRMAEEHIEEGRNVIRRLMWHMNEESGNIGWGIPEAFAEVLAQNRRLGDEFHSVLFSYITNTGKEDNFCDHDVLRRSCFRAAERLALARPDLAPKARGPFQAGLRDEDPICRDLAREALEKIGMF